MNIIDLLKKVIDMGGSDLHLSAGMPPLAQMQAQRMALGGDSLKPQQIKELLHQMLTPEQQQRLDKNMEICFSYSLPGVSRFRTNIIYQRGSLAAYFRVVAMAVPRLEELNLPPVVNDFCRFTRGLVLVAGPSGSGKSSTMAGIIDKINEEQSLNIDTLEDPIEFLFSHKKSIINQREIGSDTRNCSDSLRNLLRHNPDVIMISDMKDAETVAFAIKAVETGRMVISSLHSRSVIWALQNMLALFPEEARNNVKHYLAETLYGVLSQQLVARSDGLGKVPAVEVLINNRVVRSMLKERKEQQLYSVMKTGKAAGMQTMDQALADLHLKRIITEEDVKELCVDSDEAERLLRT